MRHRSPSLALLTCALLAPAARSQTLARIDFGSASLPTAQAGWNDLDPASLPAGLDLVDPSGAPSGVRLDAPAARRLLGSVAAGTSSPAGALLALGWPSEAYGDAMWNDLATPEAELVLSGLDGTASYDLVLTASRTGVNDVRTGLYTAAGFNQASGVLDAANNTSEVLTLSGILPDPAGAITLRLRADATNTNPNRYYYLGGLELVENPGGASQPVLGFSAQPLSIGRPQGSAPFATPLTVSTYDGATPTVALAALDDATLAAPAWLSFPGTVTAGTPFQVVVDPGTVAPGAYSATLTASAAGYPDSSTKVTLDVRAPGVLNLLYYGNSYSLFNGTVPAVVGYIAEAAGRPAPNTYPFLVGGQTLSFHLNDPTQAAAITTSLPFGEDWDFVVLQGFSTEATTALGDPQGFLEDAEAIVANVKAESPEAGCVLYQTWARGPGHSFYLPPNPAFEGPLQMHRQVEASYTQAETNMNARWGPGTCRRGRAGETAALLAFDTALYDPDLSHPAPALTLLASMTIYEALYQRRICDFVPDFDGTSGLAGWLQSYGLTAADWDALAGIAERSAPRCVRRYPGSEDDLLLRSGVLGGSPTPCPRTEAARGQTLAFTLETPIGTLADAPGMLFLQARPFAGPLAPDPVFPELWIDPGAATLLLGVGSLGGGLLEAAFPIPSGLGSARFLVQGQALATSYHTGGAFVTTDAHELVLEPGGFLRLAR